MTSVTVHYQDVIKRSADLAVAIACLLITLPVQSIIAIAIWRAMGRPIIFRQVRPGMHARPFTLYKFRTMTATVPGEDNSDGARLTSLGKLLRSTSLDEIPTLVNVVKGDMSLVGPRPLLMEYVEEYTPEQARRHEVRPGITGLAQVRGRNALGWAERLQADTEYVGRRSLRLDACVLARTLHLVLSRRGINAPGEATMTRFRRDNETP